MNVALWIAQILLIGIGVGGLMKAVTPIDKLRPKMPWVDDFSPGMVKFIGVTEVAAGLAMFLPPLTGIAEFLTPTAAVGIVIVMIGAAIVHGRRKEWSGIPVNVVFLLLAAFVAWGRFGPYAF